MNLLPFFQWCEASWIGNGIRESLWLFPVIEAVHLLGLCLLGGAVLLVDMRLLGIGLRRHPIPQIAREAAPFLAIAATLMLLTGIALFLSESVKCYYSQAFWVKITTLPVALLFTYLVRQRVAARAADNPTATTRTVAAVSMLLWFTVAAAGRWIGFS
jgi:uncharacterized protein DUF6644